MGLAAAGTSGASWWPGARTGSSWRSRPTRCGSARPSRGGRPGGTPQLGVATTGTGRDYRLGFDLGLLGARRKSGLQAGSGRAAARDPAPRRRRGRRGGPAAARPGHSELVGRAPRACAASGIRRPGAAGALAPGDWRICDGRDRGNGVGGRIPVGRGRTHSVSVGRAMSCRTPRMEAMITPASATPAITMAMISAFTLPPNRSAESLRLWPWPDSHVETVASQHCGARSFSATPS